MKTGKNNWIRWGGTVLILVSLAAAAALLGVKTYGWLNAKEEAVSDVAVSDFKVDGQAYFGSTAADDLGNIKISSESDARYLGKLKYKVSYEGISPAYIRVRILEQWVDNKTDTILDAPFTDYQLQGDQWYDNRANDYCYYLKEPAGPTVVTSSALTTSGSPIGISTEKREIVLFDGVDMSGVQGSDSSTKLTLIIQVEAVQPNRYREFWNMEHLPWETER